MSNEITDGFDTTYREYETDGVPASGPHEPVKADIRALGGTIQEQFDALQSAQAGGYVGYTSTAAMNDDLAHPAGTLAKVEGDGTYIKGSGSWTAFTDPVIAAVEAAATTATGAETAAETAQAAAEAAAAAAAATAANLTGSAALSGLYLTETIGRPVASPPVAGSVLASATYVMADPFVHGGTIQTIRLYAANTATLKMRMFSKSGTTFTQVGSDVNVAVVSGLNTKTVNIPVLAGQYIGFYQPSNGIYRNSVTADGTGWYSGTGDVTSITSATPSTSLRLEIGFDSQYVAVTAAVQQATATQVAANTVELTDHEARVANIERGTKGRQILGRPGAPVTGLSTSLGTFVWADRVIANGRISRVRAYSLSAGTAKVKVFDLVNGVLTLSTELQLTLAAGANDLALNIPVTAGQRLGFYTPTSRIPRTVVTTSDGGGYYNASGVDSSGFSVGTLNTGNRFEIGLTVEFEAERPFLLDIGNSEKIGALGDSHLQNNQVLRGKGVLAKLSAFSDWRFDSFAKSGEDILQNVNRLRSDQLVYGNIPYQQRYPTYSLIAIGQNDAVDYTLTSFLEYMRDAIETVRGVGSIPVVVAYHNDPYSPGDSERTVGFVPAWRNLAEEYGAKFVGVTQSSRSMDFGTRYAGFWDGTHYGTRTNEMLVAPLEAFVRSLGQPKQSIKLFRKRTGVSVSSVADLLYDKPFDRARLFREVITGSGALTAAAEKKSDELGAFTPTDYEVLNSEYQILQYGGSIALDDYSLLEAVLPTTAAHLDQVTLTISETAATVYCRNIMGGSLTTGAPVGAWEQISGDAGVYALSRSQLRRYMRFDKLAFLIVKTGGIAAFTAPKVEWYGRNIPKPPMPTKTEGAPATGAELLTKTLVVTAGAIDAAWTQTGTVTAGAPADGCLPRGMGATNPTGRAIVNSVKQLAQAVTWTADNLRDRDVEIRVRCRYFPDIVNSSAPYPDAAQITADTFDYARLQIDVETPNGRMPYHEKVGLWWTDVVLRTSAPILSTGFTLHLLSTAADIEIAEASVKLV